MRKRLTGERTPKSDTYFIASEPFWTQPHILGLLNFQLRCSWNAIPKYLTSRRHSKKCPAVYLWSWVWTFTISKTNSRIFLGKGGKCRSHKAISTLYRITFIAEFPTSWSGALTSITRSSEYHRNMYLSFIREVAIQMN